MKVADMAYGLYIHVPFCSARCGYCDFNTYTPLELGDSHGTSVHGYLRALEVELEQAALRWDVPADWQGVQTVFFGGGTPSMLGYQGLARALRAVKRTVGLAPGAEVTTESNPESTDAQFFDKLREEGFTRISLGMQSVAGHVLKVLERKHTPGRPVAAAKEAMAAGFEHVNLDLIYGTPTETEDDLRASLDAVVEAGVDHVSAYSLIVEDGTAMARKVRRGELPAPDDDALADRYEMIDATLREHGYSWYEVSNWSKPGGECRHNLIYWRGGQWWGAGPGAHGCVRIKEGMWGHNSDVIEQAHPGLTRTINAKHPSTYFNKLVGEEAQRSPGGAVITTEMLTPKDVRTERVMLGLRLAEGVELEATPDVDRVVERYIHMGLLERKAGQRVCLTHKGRYLADGIVTDIILAQD
ncbi:coproporphyrinogen III oxidase [Corynebacterium sp. 4HC-13]|nr:coproporphyrinogen III oxidase [Corynebacterium anserum]